MELRPGYKQTEVGVIPEDWESTIVQDIASAARNALVGGPFGSDLVSNDYVVDGVPVIRGQNLGNPFIEGPFVFVSVAKARTLEANLARPGDIVFTQRGTLGQVSLVPSRPYEKYLVSQSQMKLTLNRQAADPKFYFYVFTSSAQQDFIQQNTIQTGVPHINLGILRDIPVQFPKLHEQREIAGALGDVDTLLEALSNLIAKKRNLKQAAMQQLLTGRTRLPGFHKAWELRRFGEVFQFLRTANNPRADLSGSGDVGYLHYGDIHTSTNTFLDCAVERLPLISRTRVESVPIVEDGDLVMVDASEDNAGLGKSAEIRNVEGRQIVAGLHTFLLRGDRMALADGFKGYLQFVPSIRAALIRLATGISVFGVSKSNVMGIEVQLPAIDEQRAIATVLSDMDGELSALEARLAKTRALKSGMMQELLSGRIRLVESQTQTDLG